MFLAIFFVMVYYSEMINASQIRMARAGLRWTAPDLAKKSSVSLYTVQRMEMEGYAGRDENREAIKLALEAAGVEFFDSGAVGFTLG